MSRLISRRRLIGSLGAGTGGLLLAACDRINASPTVQNLLGLGARATMSAQRIVTDRSALVVVKDEPWVTRDVNGAATTAASRTAAHVAVRQGRASLALPAADSPVSLAAIA